jgi:hypothetical protein
MTINEIVTSNQRVRDKARQLHDEHKLTVNRIAQLLGVALITVCDWDSNHYPPYKTIRNDKHQNYSYSKTLQRPDQLRFYNYGITPEQYKQMIVDQSNQCLICQHDMGAKPCIDHIHGTTTYVRGLLCYSCNIKLGRFEQDTRMVLYLIWHWVRSQI